MLFLDLRFVTQENELAVAEGRAERPSAETQSVLDRVEAARDARLQEERAVNARLPHARAELWREWPLPAPSGAWCAGDREGVQWAVAHFNPPSSPSVQGLSFLDRYLDPSSSWWPEYLAARALSAIAQEVEHLDAQKEHFMALYRAEEEEIKAAIAAQQVGMEERLAALK